MSQVLVCQWNIQDKERPWKNLIPSLPHPPPFFFLVRDWEGKHLNCAKHGLLETRFLILDPNIIHMWIMYLTDVAPNIHWFFLFGYNYPIISPNKMISSSLNEGLGRKDVKDFGTYALWRWFWRHNYQHGLFLGPSEELHVSLGDSTREPDGLSWSWRRICKSG